MFNKIFHTILFSDSFLRSRTQHDHEATAMMKAQFMMLWDGLSTDPENTVIVMGATNRPKDLDPAILRRMPATFEISLPVNMYTFTF
jgi:ATPase family AAA domain-containing protein 1